MTLKNTQSAMLINVWREACRHIEIQEVTSRIADVISHEIPGVGLVVRRIDEAARMVEIVAAAPLSGAIEPARSELAPTAMTDLLDWCRGSSCVRATGTDLPPALRELVSASDAPTWTGALSADSTPIGLLSVSAANRKPFSAAQTELLNQLVEPFSAALETDQRLHELQRLREAAEADRRALLTKLGRSDVRTPLVGTEAGLKAVMHRVAMVAASDVPVLLFGETGTGKEVIAREIHIHSRRAAGPFIRVNCGAIPGELIDSQLFGHERGSFTGATETRKGWFERADGGTLFLDEIGDLPLAAQVRLLRVLQDGMLERVGGQRPVHVDVRVVGATHRDLPAMVRSREFREDLWYRLAVFPVLIPPLRDRTEDIGLLARHFATKAATRFGLPLALPTTADIRLLASYGWPGNVRELAAVIDRAALLGNGGRLEVAAALGFNPPASEAAAPQIADSAASPASPAGAESPDSLDDMSRRHIEHALRACFGRIEGPFGAAVRLGVHPNTLRGRMRRLQIDWRRFRKH